MFYFVNYIFANYIFCIGKYFVLGIVYHNRLDNRVVVRAYQSEW